MRPGIRNFLFYIVIGIGLVTVVLLLALFLPNVSHAWFIFIWATAFLFLFVSKMYWHQRRSGKLWTLLALLLIAHIALHTITFEHWPQFPTILFLFTVPAEIMLVAAIVKLCLNVMPGKVKL
ncbi:MAG: hypothetical protein WAK48_29405 [Candidatus Acidiferrum sp.]